MYKAVIRRIFPFISPKQTLVHTLGRFSSMPYCMPNPFPVPLNFLNYINFLNFLFFSLSGFGSCAIRSSPTRCLTMLCWSSSSSTASLSQWRGLASTPPALWVSNTITCSSLCKDSFFYKNVQVQHGANTILSDKHCRKLKKRKNVAERQVDRQEKYTRIQI